MAWMSLKNEYNRDDNGKRKFEGDQLEEEGG